MNISAIVIFLSEEDGGRRAPIMSGYRPTLLLNESEASDCMITFPDTPMVCPGNAHSVVNITILHPNLVPSLDVDCEFGLFEGIRQIGVGRVTQLSQIN